MPVFLTENCEICADSVNDFCPECQESSDVRMDQDRFYQQAGCGLVVLKCGHLFHIHCLDDYQKKKNLCPDCGKEIQHDKYFRTFIEGVEYPEMTDKLERYKAERQLKERHAQQRSSVIQAQTKQRTEFSTEQSSERQRLRLQLAETVKEQKIKQTREQQINQITTALKEAVEKIEGKKTRNDVLELLKVQLIQLDYQDSDIQELVEGVMDDFAKEKKKNIESLLAVINRNVELFVRNAETRYNPKKVNIPKVFDLIPERIEFDKYYGTDEYLGGDKLDIFIREFVLPLEPQHGDIFVTGEYRGTGTFIYNGYDNSLKCVINNADGLAIGSDYYPSIPYSITQHIDHPLTLYLQFASDPGISHIEIDLDRHRNDPILKKEDIRDELKGKKGRWGISIIDIENDDFGEDSLERLHL